MLYVINLILVMFLVSCGSEGGSSDSAEAEDGLTNQILQSTSEPESVNHALAVDGLPECNESNQKQLVFEINDKKFYTCEETQWVEIEVTNTVVNQGSSVWLDEETGKYWFVKGYSNDYSTCADSGSSSVRKSWKQAAPSEVAIAVNNGLFGGAIVKIYVASNHFIYSDDASNVLAASDFSGQIYGFTVCVSN